MLVGTGKRYRIARILGFPLYVESSILILLLIYLFLGAASGARGIVAALLFAAVAFVSIVVHEMGHALMVRRLGYGDSTIVLHGLGGVCQWRGSPTRKERILIALAGPGAGLVVGAAALALVIPLGLPNEFALRNLVLAILIINIGWSIFNLLPIWPLDGGHVLRTALQSTNRSNRETVKLSLTVSMITGGLLILAAILFSEIFIVLLVGFIVYSNYRELQQLSGPRSFYGY